MNTEDITLALSLLQREKNKRIIAIQKLDHTITNFKTELDRHRREQNKRPTQSVVALEGDNDTRMNSVLEHNHDLVSKEAAYTDKLFMVIKYHIKRASKYSAIKETFTKVTGLTKDIRKGLYKLRDSNQIVSIQFNDSNNHVYYGLAEWVIETEKGQEFREPFAPDLSADLAFVSGGICVKN